MADEDLFTPDHYTVGAVDLETAKRYVRFLESHANYGGHTGLPKEMRNKNPNESLETSLGIYDTVDVYSLPPDKCPIGTVVNFTTDINVNPEGATYVYPCEDIDAPIGYMITGAEPDELGVCLVHGVIEVPLYYFDETEEKKDFVEYDIESESFKFADSGYPVFNVYQDADGDWIAIILFGGGKGYGAVYDGPFATTIAGVTGGTMYINVAEGDIVDKHYRYTCSGINSEDEDLTDDIYLNTGETLWLGVYGATISGSSSTLTQGNSAENTEVLSDLDLIVNVVGSTYTFFTSSGTPIDLTGTTSFYRIAENVGGKLRQLQYGDIVIDGTKDNHIPPYHALGVSGSAPDGLGHTFILPVKGGTVGFWDEGGGAVGVWTNNDGTSTHVLVNKIPYTATEDGWIRISVIDDGTSDGECLSFFSATGGVPLYKYCAVSGGTGSSGGGGGIGFPDYSLLGGSTISISGTTGYTGVGVTYLIPVPGGVAIEYETEAPECIDVARFASFLDSANSVSHDLVIDTPWQTPSDGGWVRISVLDNGLHREGCLRFFVDGVDWSNALPLYRYGDYRGTTPPPAYSYTGSFKAEIDTVESVAGEDIIINGSSIGVGIDGDTVTKYLKIYDSKNRNTYRDYAGYVQYGEKKFNVPAYSTTYSSGDVIYLVGTYTTDANNDLAIEFEYEKLSSTYFPTISTNQFYARICYIDSDGKVKQTQYGDIIQPVRLVGDGTSTVIEGNTIHAIVSGSQSFTQSVSGGTATIGLTGSTSTVSFTGKGNVEITKVRATASAEEMATWGTRPDGTAKNAGWKGIIPISDGRVMTEETIGVIIGGEEVDIPLITPYMDDDELYVISLLATGKIGVDDIPDGIIDKAKAWAGLRMGQGKSPYYNGDASDETLRVIDTDSIVILGLDSPSYGLGFPDFVALSGSSISGISGSTVDVGGGTFYRTGVTYLIPVPGNATIKYYTEAPDCIDEAIFAPFLGDTETHIGQGLTNGISYTTPSGGWVRISVIDDGAHAGDCVRFFVDGDDWSNALPLFRCSSYDGTGTATYTGAFAATYVENISEGVVVSRTVTIQDTKNRDTTNQYAGWVYIGKDRYPVTKYTSNYNAGDSIYLRGTVAADGEVTLSFIKVENGSYFPSNISANQFYTRICYSDASGKMYQAQYGDIIQPIRYVGDGTNIEVRGNTIAYIGGGSLPVSGAIGYPDYYALGGSGVTGSTSSVVGIGTTYLLPVPGGVNIKYQTDAPECIAKAIFASYYSGSGSHNTIELHNNEAKTTTSGGGWVRISVLDNGMHKGNCLRFFVDGVDYTNSLPLFRYGDYKDDLGFDTLVTGNTAFIGITGGTNNVVIKGGNNVTVTGNTDGEIILDASGDEYRGSFHVTCSDSTAGNVVTHNYTIEDTSNRHNSNNYAGWVHIGDGEYPVAKKTGTFVDGDVVYLVGTFASDNSLSFDFDQFQMTSSKYFPANLGENQFCVRLGYATNGKMYQTQYGDIVQPARYVGDGSTVQIKGNTISALNAGSTQDLTRNVTGGTAFIGITDSTSSVAITGGSNMSVELDNRGTIILNATVGDSFEYDGPFAVSGSPTGSNNALSVTISKGYVSIGGRFVYVNAVTTPQTLNNNCSVWATVTYNPTTSDPSVSYSYNKTVNTQHPTTSDNTFLVEIARNVGGVLHQVHFGGIECTDDKNGGSGSTQDLSISLSGPTATVGITDGSGYKLIAGNGITFNANDPGELIIGTTVSGGTGGGGSYPVYTALGNDSPISGTTIYAGHTYKTTSSGWLRISTNSSSGCCSVRIDGADLGLGNGSSNGMTWLLPINTNSTFWVSSVAHVIKFDGSCYEYSGGAKSASRGLSKGGNDSLIEEPKDIMLQYTSPNIFDDDYDVIKAIAVEAENSKDEIANLCRTVQAHNRSSIILSTRCELSASHTEELCVTASNLYQDALDTEKVEDAQAYLEEADYYANLANTWLNNASGYMTTIDDTYNDDKNTDYDSFCTDAIENTSKCYEEASEENERLLIIGVTGGSNYLSNIERCIREANEWYSSTTEELDNEEIVYSSSYKIASNAYTDANEAYGKLVSKGNEARVYVNGLSKPVQKK